MRMNQQQENHKFLSHFKRKLVIRRGRRSLSASADPELFHMRANGTSICTRTIQLDCKAAQLNSAFYYILRVPLHESEDGPGKIFVWKGSKSDPFYHKLAEEVIKKRNKKILSLTSGSQRINQSRYKIFYPIN